MTIKCFEKVTENRNGVVVSNKGTLAFFKDRNDSSFLPYSTDMLLR
jgi:hypothetical protein